MYSLFFLSAVAFALSLFLTPAIRDLFARWNLVDVPDDIRKRHEQPVPRVGGVPVLLSYLASFGLLLLFNSEGGSLVQASLATALKLMPAALIVFGVGLADDLIGLRPWQKFVGQGVAAAAAYAAGIQVSGVVGYTMPAWLSLPITIVWLVLCANAVNLIDGVDGLAAGVGLFSTCTMLIAGLMRQDVGLALATAPLAGCLLGFLRYNFNPATIFLGDSGSLLVGFLLGCFGVLWSSKAATIFGMTAPMMTLAIPLLDTGLAIIRRFLSGKPIFEGDRGHIHHRLIDRGFTPRKVALILYAVCAIGATFSLFMAAQHFELAILFIFCGVAWVGVQHLGYVEFGVAGRMFVEGAFRRQLGAQISLQHWEQALNEAQSPQDCWTIIEPACREFEFDCATMTLWGEKFSFGDSSKAESPSWELRIALRGTDSVTLHRSSIRAGHSSSIAPFADMLAQTLSLKYHASNSETPAVGQAQESSAYAQAASQLSRASTKL